MLRFAWLGVSRVLLIGEFSEAEMCRLLRWSDGFLTWRGLSRELPRGTRHVCKGHLLVPPHVLERSVMGGRGASRRTGRNPGPLDLSRRQTEIVSLLRARKSNKEIASELRISINTVKFHLAKLFAITGAPDRLRLAEIVLGPAGERIAPLAGSVGGAVEGAF